MHKRASLKRRSGRHAAALTCMFCAGCAQPRSASVAALGQAVLASPPDWETPAGNIVLNTYASLTSDIQTGDTALTVDDVSVLTDPTGAPLQPGNLLLLYQAQGATIDTADGATYGALEHANGAGSFEFVEVSAVTGTRIDVSCPLSKSFTVNGHSQVVRVADYGALSIASNTIVESAPWNGVVGGIVVIKAQTLSLFGAVSVTGQGFRGGVTDDSSALSIVVVDGYRSTQATAGGRKGESVAGSQQDYASLGGEFGRGAPANGGGGGNSHNAGGGGGANTAMDPTLWTGQGVMREDVEGALAWELDPGYAASGNQLSQSPGGGRGGYTFSSVGRDALSVAPGELLWGGNFRGEYGGLGGHVLAADPLARVYLGGGGGAGDGNDDVAGPGAPGGGLILIVAENIVGSGQLIANGAGASNVLAPANDAPGGGGGGGSIVVDATNLSADVTIRANGGQGGSQFIHSDEAEGPGGGGGGGLIATRAAHPSLDVSGGLAGVTTSTGMTSFPSNGATAGNSGLTVELSGLTLCRDELAPDTYFTQTPPALHAEALSVFEFGSDDATAMFICCIDNGECTPCASPIELTLEDGTHRVAVRAHDAVGNVDATPALFDVTVDTLAPDTLIERQPPRVTPDDTATLVFASNELDVTFECRVDNAVFEVCSAEIVLERLTPGSHHVEVRAIDAAGNVDATPASATWTVSVVDAAVPREAAAPPDVVLDGGTDAALVVPATDAWVPPVSDAEPAPSLPLLDAAPTLPSLDAAPKPTADAAPVVATPFDAASGESTQTPVLNTFEGGGCSCRLSHSKPTSKLWYLAPLIAAFVRRRSRRRYDVSASRSRVAAASSERPHLLVSPR